MSYALELTKILLSVSLIITNRQQEHYSLIHRQKIDDKYDYIVIGAGSAGSVVASRLSEHARIKVLIVNAGSAETVVSDMPSMTPTLWGSEMDWNFTISPQTNSHFGYNGNSVPYSQGKVMGGSSTINAMAYVRGLPLDFDNWKTFGVDGWSYNEVLPYFIKSENNSDLSLSHHYHGFKGPLHVSTVKNPQLISETMIRAANELGYNEIDLNDPKEKIGVAIQQMTIRDGSRGSAAKSFLESVKNRPNLHIWANSLATKINFDNNKRAVSVTILKSGKVFTVKAQKEIILSAGAINSAKLLMLSGIGPKDHLKELNIPLVVDLPVGHNFHDQPMTFGVHFTINETQKSYELLQKDITEFFLNGTGVLAQFEKAVLRTSTKYETNKSWPDIQVFANPGSFADFQTAESAENALNIKQNIWQKFYKPYSGQSTISFIPLLSRPQSRGRIKLKSNNIRDDPIIDPNYFSNSIDLKTLVEGMKLGYILGQTKAFVDTFRAKPFRTQVPNCPSISFNSYSSFSLPSYSSFYPSSSSSSSSYSYSSSYFYSSSYSFSSSSSSYWSHSSSSSAPFIPSDEYLECVAKTLTNTFNHLAGTARMGSKNDKKAVVSSELKVHGIHGLRVIDASVCPQATSGGLYATVLAIAEKGVHYILNDLHKY